MTVWSGAPVSRQIPCVVPEWLYDSVERGSCLAMEQYTTSDKNTKRSSTPTKNHTMASGEGTACVAGVLQN